MKKVIYILPLFFLFISFSSLQAQEKKKKKNVITTEFSVRGNCGMCGDRIENAALIKGVKRAEWDSDKEMIVVVYREDKVSEEAIHKAIAEKGHETSKAKANEKAYNGLAKCCQYKTEKCDN